MCNASGQVESLPGATQTTFKYNGTTFIVEYQQRSETQASPHVENQEMVVRYFGPTNHPLRDLFAHVRQQALKSTKLSIIKIVAGSRDVTTKRNKRPLSSIDLEPGLKDDITRDAELFFGEGSQYFFEASSQPWRRGYLHHSAPGCGKSSLSVALASHFNVPLVLVTLKGMDDKDLMDAFGRLPHRCVVLLEDIDCAGAEVENRYASKPVAQEQAPLESASAVSLDTVIQVLIAQQVKV